MVSKHRGGLLKVTLFIMFKGFGEDLSVLELFSNYLAMMIHPSKAELKQSSTMK